LVFFVVDAWLKIFQRTILGARLDGRQPAPAASLELRRRLVDLNQSLPTEIRQLFVKAKTWEKTNDEIDGVAAFALAVATSAQAMSRPRRFINRTA
jgi:hypothetical protein